MSDVVADQAVGWQPPSAGLCVGPTPVEPWPRFGAAVGLDVVAKRDDMSPVGLGGNKIRKLDLILGEALESGVTDILTVGGLQSNHGRLTAAAAARLGLGCHLFLRGLDRGNPTGNVLLGQLFGARVDVFDVDDFDDLLPEVHRRMEALSAKGRRPLFIPLGGATTLGTFAYVSATAELRQQLDSQQREIDRIVVAVGTGSTLAGIALGAALHLPGVSIVGVSVSRPAAHLADAVGALMADTAHLVPDARLVPPEIVDDFVGPGYTKPGERTAEAVRLLARTEGVVADLTYTGKALEFLLASGRAASRHSRTLFWHTGGFPEIFARTPADVLLPFTLDGEPR